MAAVPRHVAGGGSAAVMGVMSDAPSPAETESSIYPPYDRSLELALALARLSAEVRAEWRHKYITQGEAELRVQAPLDRAAAALRSAGKPATVRTVWIMLADRAGASGDPDLRAAAALAGMAMGLRPS